MSAVRTSGRGEKKTEMNFHVRGIGKTWPRAGNSLSSYCHWHWNWKWHCHSQSHNGHLGIDFRQLNVGIIKSTAKRPQNVFRKLAASANKPTGCEWKSPQCEHKSEKSTVECCTMLSCPFTTPSPSPCTTRYTSVQTMAQTGAQFFIHRAILMFTLKRRHNNNLSPGM